MSRGPMSCFYPWMLWVLWVLVACGWGLYWLDQCSPKTKHHAKNVMLLLLIGLLVLTGTEFIRLSKPCPICGHRFGSHPISWMPGNIETGR